MTLYVCYEIRMCLDGISNIMIEEISGVTDDKQMAENWRGKNSSIRRYTEMEINNF